VRFQGEGEACDRAGNGNGAVADGGSLFVQLAIGLDVHIAGGFCRSSFAVIEKAGFAAGETHEHEAATTDVSGGGFDDGESEGGGDGGVNGVATAFEDFHAGLGGEGFVGGHHAVGAADRFARRVLG